MKTIMTIPLALLRVRRLRFKIYAFACRGVYMTTERAVMGGKKVTFLSFSRDKFTPV